MSLSSPRDSAWIVFDYEVDMFHNLAILLGERNEEGAKLSFHVRNAVVESCVLHTRILVGILLSDGTYPDDIKLTNLVPGFKCPELDQLKQVYEGPTKESSPRWIFNKMLAHATTQRSDSFDYEPALNQVAPLICNIVNNINAER